MRLKANATVAVAATTRSTPAARAVTPAMTVIGSGASRPSKGVGKEPVAALQDDNTIELGRGDHDRRSRRPPFGERLRHPRGPLVWTSSRECSVPNDAKRAAGEPVRELVNEPPDHLDVADKCPGELRHATTGCSPWGARRTDEAIAVKRRAHFSADELADHVVLADLLSEP